MQIYGRDILFYDIEVYPKYYLIVFCKIDGSVAYILDSSTELGEFRETLDHIINRYTLVGYNNFHYDDVMLSKMVTGNPANFKAYNDGIIVHKERYGVNKSLKSIDLMKDIATDVDGGGLKFFPLKLIQLNLGENIYETPIDFNYPYDMTTQQISQIKEYCINDVITTIDVFNKLIDNVHLRIYLQKELDEKLGDNTYLSRGTITGLVHTLFTPVQGLFSLKLENILFNSDKITNYYNTLRNKRIFELKEQEFYLFDNHIKVKQGGLHSVNPEFTKKLIEDVGCLDVVSMYPHIIKKNNLLFDKTDKYYDLFLKRKEVKAKLKGDITEDERVELEKLSNNYKLTLNKLYGSLGNKYMKNCDNLKLLSICLNGQMLILQLMELLFEEGIDVIQGNTDGVFFTNYTQEQVNRVWHQWEHDNTGYKLEFDKYDKFYQKDVNNLVAKTGDNYKFVGGDVKYYFGRDILAKNPIPIISKLIVNKLINDTPFHETFLENKNLEDYTYSARVTSKYKCIVDENGNEYQKVNRLLATMKGVEELYKIKPNGAKCILTNLPKNVTVINENLEMLYFNQFDIDYNYYTEIASARLKDWGLNV